MTIVYLNGVFLEEKDASIPVTDRGFLFGDGVFTTVKVSKGKPHFIERHLERLSQQCEMLLIEKPSIPVGVIEELIERNHAKEGVWRMKIIVTGGDAPTLSLPMRPCGQLLITMKSYDETVNPQKLAVYPSPIIRPLSPLKSLAYLDRLSIKEYALRQGVDDAVVLSPEGYLTETAFSNLFWCCDNVLYTPSRELSLMQGIALEAFCQEAKKGGMEVVEVKAPLEELTSKMHLFTCNTMTGAIPVTHIGEREFSRDETLEKALCALCVSASLR